MSLDDNNPPNPLADNPPTDDPPPAPSHPVEPPAPVEPPLSDEGPKDADSILAGLQTQMANLLDTVTDLASKVSTPEQQPAKKPWTHWGSK